ncbi:MAG: hypothetical protein ACI9JM_003164 [Halioglobus sp.]|jgi:hypothetical protein
MSIDSFQIAEVSAVLRPDLKLQPVKITPAFYADMDREFSRFKDHVLIAKHTFTEDWPTWEKHPKGDEMVMLLEG